MPPAKTPTKASAQTSTHTLTETLTEAPTEAPTQTHARTRAAGRDVSSVIPPPADVDQRIALRVAELRSESGFTLDELAGRSGVSRAMISKIERMQTSPTAVVLNKLAIGLGVLLPTLLGFTVKGPPLPRSPITRRKDQPRWEDPDSGYQRRTLTPPDVMQPMQLNEIWFPPRLRMTFENAPGGRPVCQQIWMLSGEMRVRQGDKDKEHRLTAGDCLALTLDQAVHFHNAGGSAARYLVVTSTT
jgi:transcriptional regulator with XRE-family HTH domain